MFLPHVQPTEESDAGTICTLVILEDGFVLDLEVLADDLTGGFFPHY